MASFSQALIPLLQGSANAKLAEGMAAYMKHKFEFYGIPAPLRNTLYNKAKPSSATITTWHQLQQELDILWDRPQRECHYCAVELLLQYKKLWHQQPLSDITHYITNNSWWDTVDGLASNAVGYYFTKNKKEQSALIPTLIQSDNMWLQRTAIIYQLKYKLSTDTTLLTQAIIPHLGSNEFFIQKAIGWALRQYSKHNVAWVQQFIQQHTLKPLSLREASKYLPQ
jgi:3-methyladenine DNA glycosylase AlkD